MCWSVYIFRYAYTHTKLIPRSLAKIGLVICCLGFVCLFVFLDLCFDFSPEGSRQCIYNFKYRRANENTNREANIYDIKTGPRGRGHRKESKQWRIENIFNGVGLGIKVI